jgi:hypothetical protein
MNFSGVLKKLLKSSQLRHVSLSVARMELLGSHWTDFHEILYLIFLENLLRKLKFL